MDGHFIPSVSPPATLGASGAFWFVYSGHRLLVDSLDGKVTVPKLGHVKEPRSELTNILYLGALCDHPCYAAIVRNPGGPPPGSTFRELRSLFGVLDDQFFDVALRAVHLVEWDKICRFCTQCRAELRHRNDIRAKECSQCGRLEFPRLSPAIIVLIEKDDKLLLARSPRFAGEFFSVLAGFVEPGESLEDAVRREVMEEVGIAVKEINYFGSQPWPFPDSLMIGFTAQYDSGEIQVDGEEIIEAGWYTAGHLPQIPGKISIARRLIDHFIAKHTR
jgi:NAD+ diphosphatase